MKKERRLTAKKKWGKKERKQIAAHNLSGQGTCPQVKGKWN
jgi:hypothetical protein